MGTFNNVMGRTFQALMAFFLALILTACGGGASDSSSGTVGTAISPVSTGNGRIKIALTDTAGTPKIDLNSSSPLLLIRPK